MANVVAGFGILIAGVSESENQPAISHGEKLSRTYSFGAAAGVASAAAATGVSASDDVERSDK